MKTTFSGFLVLRRKIASSPYLLILTENKEEGLLTQSKSSEATRSV